MALPIHKFSRERLLSWIWQFIEYWLSEKAPAFGDVSRDVSYKENNKCLQVYVNKTEQLGQKNKKKRNRRMSKLGVELSLFSCIKLSDWRKVDTQETYVEKVNGCGRGGEVRKGKEEKDLQGKRGFTENWRINERHVNKEEPKFPPLSSRSWEPQYLCICLFLARYTKMQLSVSFLFKKKSFFLNKSIGELELIFLKHKQGYFRVNSEDGPPFNQH